VLVARDTLENAQIVEVTLLTGGRKTEWDRKSVG
jgi:hypothetical protein